MITIDERLRRVTIEEDGVSRTLALDSREAFEALTKIWIRSGWEAKYIYTFSWFGRPVIQLPDDLIRMQEVLFALKPDVLIETGIAHGGSIVFYASLFEAMHHGRVIGVDVDIRAHNRAALEEHELRSRFTLIEGSSIAPEIVAGVRSHIAAGETVMVVLDSNHLRDHVRAELEAYAPLVTPGSYIVATDGIMKDLVGSPRAADDWEVDNPQTAVFDFLKTHPEFELTTPAWPFNESDLSAPITHWPNAWLKRR